MARFDNIDILILAGGLGTRIREETETKPKPMIQIGDKPILMHLIDRYIEFGAKRFLVLGGYKIDVIHEYLSQVCIKKSNKNSSRYPAVFEVQIFENNVLIELFDTGIDYQTAERISQVSEYIYSKNFAVTYGDSISDINLDEELDLHLKHNKIATVTAVQPRSRFGRLQIDENKHVYNFDEKPIMNEWINGGYFIFKKIALETIRKYKVLEKGPLQDFVKSAELLAFKHRGFWQPMDTYREFELLNRVWKENGDKFW
jgi:glucose-1-phosphate cytidylyltransferase